MVTLGVLLWPSLLLRSASSGDLAIHCLGLLSKKQVVGSMSCGENPYWVSFFGWNGMLKVGGPYVFFCIGDLIGLFDQ